MPYTINLLDNGSVVTADGEYLGTWRTDEFESLYEFIPDGDSEPIFSNPHLGLLCKQIENWHSGD